MDNERPRGRRVEIWVDARNEGEPATLNKTWAQEDGVRERVETSPKFSAVNVLGASVSSGTSGGRELGRSIHLAAMFSAFLQVGAQAGHTILYQTSSILYVESRIAS